MKNTQEVSVLNYMKNNGSINPAQAFYELGIYRLSAVIYNIRKRKIDVITERKLAINKHGNRTYYAEYRLA